MAAVNKKAGPEGKKNGAPKPGDKKGRVRSPVPAGGTAKTSGRKRYGGGKGGRPFPGLRDVLVMVVLAVLAMAGWTMGWWGVLPVAVVALAAGSYRLLEPIGREAYLMRNVVNLGQYMPFHQMEGEYVEWECLDFEVNPDPPRPGIRVTLRYKDPAGKPQQDQVLVTMSDCLDCGQRVYRVLLHAAEERKLTIRRMTARQGKDLVYPTRRFGARRVQEVIEFVLQGRSY